jgi:hypothetical protein
MNKDINTIKVPELQIKLTELQIMEKSINAIESHGTTKNEKI